MANLFLARPADNKVYAYAGFTSTLVGTIDTAAGLQGVDILASVSGNHVITHNSTTCYKHAAGWSSTIIESFLTSAAFGRDVGHDASGNVQMAFGLFNIFGRFAGFSSTLLASFSAAVQGDFANTDSSGDTVANRRSSPPNWVRYTQFTSTVNNSFSVLFITSIPGGAVNANDDTLSVNYSALFGGLQLVTWYSGFTSSPVAQISSPIVGPAGMAYYEGTFDFSILFFGQASIIFTTSGVLDASAAISGAAAIVFGTSGILELTAADLCHWISGAELAGWLAPASGAWQAAGAAEWFDAVAPGDWAVDADGDWFDPKECS